VTDARDRLIGLIRQAIEDEAGLELVTQPGRATPRGGYETTWMLARDGTATAMTIEAVWYLDTAGFTLTGPAVEQAEGAFWSDRGLFRSRQNAGRGPLQCRILTRYGDADRIGQLLSVLPALAKAYGARETSGQGESVLPSSAADSSGPDQGATAALTTGPEFLGPPGARRTAAPAVRPRGTTGSPSVRPHPRWPQ
jgi:hypothetical protein